MEVKEAQVQAERALALAREVGYQNAIGMSLSFLGLAALAKERYQESERYYQEQLSVYQALGYPIWLSGSYKGLGDASIGLGQLDQARVYYCRALRIQMEIGSVVSYIESLPTMAGPAACRLAELTPATTSNIARTA